MKTIRIENWGVVSSPEVTPYTPPECITTSLSGEVYGHLRIPDGEFVVTSNIVKAEGRLVYTRSGSVYELGKVAARYEKEYPGRDYEGEKPITFKS